MRRGILGGVFNPPHIGHLVCAQEARWQLELESVVLMPVGDAPHKEIAQDPGREQRYELCRLAAQGDDGLSVSRLEIERDGPSYTVETLQALRDEAPEDELFFIMGGDQAEKLPEWREPESVLRLATVAVAEREQWRRDRIRFAMAALEAGKDVTFFSMPGIEISSTMVRERMAAGGPIRHLVPGAVAAYIEQNGMYRARVGT